jgi:hypothetical protein
MADVYATFVAKVREKMAEVATASCERPKSEPFDHGQQVGKYQGLQEAVEIFQDIIRDVDN